MYLLASKNSIARQDEMQSLNLGVTNGSIENRCSDILLGYYG